LKQGSKRRLSVPFPFQFFLQAGRQAVPGHPLLLLDSSFSVREISCFIGSSPAFCVQLVLFAAKKLQGNGFGGWPPLDRNDDGEATSAETRRHPWVDADNAYGMLFKVKNQIRFRLNNL
jgi:hypothetical protein